ncbi:MAG: hypothetical protein ABIK07_14760, partial [Planctomycetota bacterium]
VRKKKKTILRDEKTDISVDAVLESVIQILRITLKKNEEDPDLRLTIYRLTPDKKYLKQHTKYFGIDLQYSKVRHKIEISKGVIGAAYRTKKVAPLNRDPKVSDAEFREDMVKGFGFTEEEAKALRDDRKAWIALPVKEETGIHTILYCDSKVHKFFGTENSVRYKILEAACAGLAEFLAKS